MASSGAASTSVVSVASEPEMVEFGGRGSGVLIVKNKHEAMQHVTQEIDWVNLFLDGVFPNVDKGKIRSKREGPGMHVIPDNVMSHAREEYRTWLTSKCGKSAVEATKLVKNLGTRIGKASMDRRGPRGLQAKLKEARNPGCNHQSI